MGAQSRSPRRRDRIVLRPPIVLRQPPLGFDQPSSRESVEGGIERSLIEQQHGLRGAFDPLRHAVTVLRPPGQRLQNKEVEAFSKDVQLSVRHGRTYVASLGPTR